MEASVPINHASELLQETEGGGDRFTSAQLLAWLNEAQRVIQSLVPRANPVTTVVTCTANETRHTLPDGTTAMLRPICNMGTDGATPGRTVRLYDENELTGFSSGWHSATGEATIKGIVYDLRDPRTYWTYPRAHATTVVTLRMLLSQIPSDCSASTDSLTVLDEFEPAIVDWIMYRCLGRDSEETPNFAAAMGYKKSFVEFLGMSAEAVARNAATYMRATK